MARLEVKRVLVTGASGCVGRHVVPLLAARGWDVHAVSGKQRPEPSPGVSWHRADLLDARAATALAHDVSASGPSRRRTSRGPGQA